MAEIINEVSVEPKNTMRGKISILKALHGKSAYEIAVIHGFSGTEEEWLESLVAQNTKISTVTLPSNLWQGTESPYSQVVDIAGATANSKIDINPTIEQLNIFKEKDITFVVANSNGTITVYCIGQKPANDYTLQVSMTEVKRYE